MNNKINRNILRQFGILFGFLFPFLIGWLVPYIYGHNFKIWTFYFGLAFILIGLINSKLLYYPYRIWIKIGDVLGYINSHVILGSVFFVVLLPISIIMKFFGYDPLNIKNKSSKFNTYRINNSDHKINFKNIF